MGTCFSSFATRTFQTLSKKFLPDTDEAIEELLSFEV
jgi:hypothetical protein